MNPSNIKIEKKVNGNGNEVISATDTEMMRNGFKGVRLFSTLSSTSDDEIIQNACFEIGYFTKEEYLKHVEKQLSNESEIVINLPHNGFISQNEIIEFLIPRGFVLTDFQDNKMCPGWVKITPCLVKKELIQKALVQVARPERIERTKQKDFPPNCFCDDCKTQFDTKTELTKHLYDAHGWSKGDTMRGCR